MKEYIGSDEHFIDSVNARHEQNEQDDKRMKEEIDKQIDSQEWEPFGWTPLQIATYAINCPKEDKYFEEVAQMIERYADTRIWQELELPAANCHTCKNCGFHCECQDQPCSCCANEINLGTIG